CHDRTTTDEKAPRGFNLFAKLMGKVLDVDAAQVERLKTETLAEIAAEKAGRATAHTMQSPRKPLPAERTHRLSREQRLIVASAKEQYPQFLNPGARVRQERFEEGSNPERDEAYVAWFNDLLQKEHTPVILSEYMPNAPLDSRCAHCGTGY